MGLGLGLGLGWHAFCPPTRGKHNQAMGNTHETHLLQALVVKAVDLGYLPRLVIPPEKRYVPGVQHLEEEEQGQGLNRVVTPVHEISHEDVRRRWGCSSCREKLE